MRARENGNCGVGVVVVATPLPSLYISPVSTLSEAAAVDGYLVVVPLLLYTPRVKINFLFSSFQLQSIPTGTLSWNSEKYSEVQVLELALKVIILKYKY